MDALSVVCLCVCVAGCYENVEDRDSEAVKALVAAASKTFQANHDGDRREEAGLLFPRTPLGAATEEVREFLGDPTPGFSEPEKWIYELGGKDTITLYFSDGVLRTKYWLVAPAEQQADPPLLVNPGVTDNAEESQPKRLAEDAPLSDSGPTVSTGTSRSRTSP